MKHFAETFKITNEKDYSWRKSGFKAYNSQGKCVGVIFMTDDKRVAAYGNCELCVYPEFKNRYGEWHRIRSHGSSHSRRGE